MPTTDQTQPLALSDAEQRLTDTTPAAYRETRLEFLLEQVAQFSDLANAADGHVENQNKNSTARLTLAAITLEIAGLMLDLDRHAESWQYSRPCVETFIQHQQFEQAARACQYVYLADQQDAVAAIGQAAWLAVTYPVNPDLSATILDHIIDETPDDSDGAAVAAATAHYVVDLRSAGSERDELAVFTGAMLARVARRHSQVDAQNKFELWVERMQLDQPDKFLVRLRNVIDVMVQDDWWFDREKLQSEIPDEQ